MDDSNLTRRDVIVLGGGLGGSRLAAGLLQAGLLENSRVLANVADDTERHGLAISPDLDTVLYRLAGRIDDARGWGLRNDSYSVIEELGRLGEDNWFTLGDRDLATHLFRTERLRRGVPLSQVTRELCEAFGVPAVLSPITDDRLRTIIELESGESVDFQTYHVRLRSQPVAVRLTYLGAEDAKPAPHVLEEIRHARLVILAASSPAASLLPMLSVAGVRDALAERSAATVALSPHVSRLAPTGSDAHRARTRCQLLRALGHDADAMSVARLYADVADVYVVDERDRAMLELGDEFAANLVLDDTIVERADLAAGLIKRLLHRFGDH
jgi:LPPG:FO 2-phospho-L-lactate transferase